MSEGYEDWPAEGAPERGGQAEAFDVLGERYDEAFPHKEGQLAGGEWLIKRLPPNSRVLDVGCGTGLPTARQLSDAGHRVLGVDLSARMVELSRQNVPDGDFLQRDFTLLEAEGRQGIGQFEGIACFFSLLMLPRSEIPETLVRLRELLVPRGLISLSMVEADLDDAVIPFIGETIRVSGYLRDELRQVVRDAGLEIAGEDSYAYAPASATTAPEHQLFLNCRRT